MWDYRGGECSVRDVEFCHYLKKLNGIFHLGVSYIVSCARCGWGERRAVHVQLPAGAGCLAFSVLTYLVVICSLVGAAVVPARDVIVFSVLPCCGLAGVSCARAAVGACVGLCTAAAVIAVFNKDVS